MSPGYGRAPAIPALGYRIRSAHLPPRSSSAQGLGERPLQPGEVVGLAVMVRGELVGPAGRSVPYVFAGTLDKGPDIPGTDRKSTRLNSSHVEISYAVFCLKK